MEKPSIESTKLQLALATSLMSVLLISQGPSLSEDLSGSSSSSVEISGMLSEAKMSGRSHTLALSSDEVRIATQHLVFFNGRWQRGCQIQMNHLNSETNEVLEIDFTKSKEYMLQDSHLTKVFLFLLLLVNSNVAKLLLP